METPVDVPQLDSESPREPDLLAERSSIRRLLDVALAGPAQKFQKKLSQFVKGNISFHMLGFPRDEHVIQAFLLGMLIQFASGFEVKVEQEGGDGRTDLTICEKNGPRAVIIEFKKAKSAKGLKAAAEIAQAQIQGNHYRAFLGEDVTQLREYGLGFYSKKLYVTCKTFTRRQGRSWKEVKNAR